MRIAPLLLLPLIACAESPPVQTEGAVPAQPVTTAAPVAATTAPAAPSLRFTQVPIPLPGATGEVSLDYLAVDRTAGRVWIPAGGTGSVDALEIATGKVTRIEGFPTVERESKAGKRVMGPSSATVGEGMIYVGNRAGAEVCAVDPATMKKGACVKLASSPDGLLYVPVTKEVWATTPKDKTLTILDASSPARLVVKATIPVPGEPEGYAVDAVRGLYFTNLEDGDKTLVVDVRARKIQSTWEAHCGADNARGLAIDTARGFLFVACTDHVNVVDLNHDGALLSKVDTGEGVDNIDYLDTRGQLYAAAGKAGTLTVARVGDKGSTSVIASVPSTPGGRVVVVDGEGAAYIADGKQGRVLALKPAP